MYSEQKKHIKKRGIIITAAVVIVICALALYLFSNNMTRTGLVRVRVRDAGTDAPIAGAQVIIPETGDVCFTDEQGMTPIMELPVLLDAHYNQLMEQEYGLITILVYCEGYVPYALYFAHVEPNRLRAGPNVWLFPGEGAPFSIIEGPDEAWSQRFIEEYAP